MAKCRICGKYRAWRLADSRIKCLNCGARHRWRENWTLSRLPEAVKDQLLERFVLGVPVYRQRFRRAVSATAAGRFYRLIRAACAYVEHLREPCAGRVELDETIPAGV